MDTTGLALNQGFESGPLIELWQFTTVSPTVELVVPTAPVNENAVNGTVEAKLNTPSSQTITATLTTSNGTAVAGSDYNTPSAQFVFPPGQVNAVVSVPIIDDAEDEVNETISLALGSPINAVLGAVLTDTMTIIDNDGDATVAIRSAI